MMPQVPQIRRIIFNDEEIGMGFNSESGLAVGTALDSFTIAENPTAPGGEVTASISIVNTHEELQENLGMSFEAQGRYGFFSASAKTKFSESTKFNSTSTFLVASCLVENSMRRGKNFKVTAEAKALLDSNRTDDFSRAFGDSFVRGLQTGGEFYAVIRITSISTSKQSELAATLQAEANGLVASGSFKAAFTEANTSESTRSEFTATMYQKAGTGTQISPIVSIEDVIQRYQQFPEIARVNAAAYETEVATYDTLPLPLPTPEEHEDFLIALADAREKKLKYIQNRNDLEFALKNPMFFQDLPSPEILNEAIEVYTKLMNAVMAHAIKISRGQIKPPQLFDPASLSPPLTEPAPIFLNRVQKTTSPPQVKVPTFTSGALFQPMVFHAILRKLGLNFRDSGPLEIMQDGHRLIGDVVGQSPPGGTMVDVGAEVELVIGNYHERGPIHLVHITH
jgi:hypothetical protein